MYQYSTTCAMGFNRLEIYAEDPNRVLTVAKVTTLLAMIRPN